jgi:hypothetical protein
MDAQRKRDIGIAVFVIGVTLAWIIFGEWRPFTGAGDGPVKGVVLSISGSGERREALVQLDQGGEVRAVVPKGCAVFPGYVATIVHSGGSFGTGAKFTLLSAVGKE